MMEIEALFTTADGPLRGVPRNPDLVLTIQCVLSRVGDLTQRRTSIRLLSRYLRRFTLNRRAAVDLGQQRPDRRLHRRSHSTPSAGRPFGLGTAPLANLRDHAKAGQVSRPTFLVSWFKTFAIYAGAVICFGGLIFAGIRMMSGRFQDAIPGLFGALFGAGVLGWGAGWIGSLTGQSM